MPPLTQEEFQKQITSIEFAEGVSDADRTIPAAWIKDLFPEPARVATNPIRIKRAIIDGDLTIRYAKAPYEIELTDCDFTGNVDWTGTRFERVVYFSRSRFHGTLKLRLAHVEHDIYLRGGTCDQAVDFNDLEVKRVFNVSGTVFRGSFHMERADVGTAFFRVYRAGQPTRFEKVARLLELRADSIDADGVQFAGEAEFERMKIERIAFFGVATVDDDLEPMAAPEPATFGGDTTFQHAQFGPEADFRGAQFLGAANFQAVRVDGRLLLASREESETRFAGPANFTGMEVGERLAARGVAFQGPAVFADARIRGSMFLVATFGHFLDCSYLNVAGTLRLFDDQSAVTATFAERASFDGVHAGSLLAEGVTFPPGTTFRGMDVDRAANFNGAEFTGDAEFRAVKIGGKLSLEATKIAGWLLLRDGQATAFGAPALADQCRVDARGFTFGRIDGDGTRLRELLRRQEPYDLRLYEQAERHVRDSGDEDLAGTMYLDRRRRETRENWKSGSRLLAVYGLLQEKLFRYGVRPLRLLVVSILVVGLGWWAFSRDGAVRPKDANAAPVKLTCSQALAYSARVFMPIGDLPLGAQLIPTDRTLPYATLTYEGWATIQRLLGLVLVPLGIAALTGLLVRKR